MVLSPYSVAVALGMTLPGAAGRTATEMRQVLGVRNDDRFHGGLNALSAYVEGLAGTQHRADGSGAELALEGANQLYGQEGLAWARAVDEDGTEAAAATAVVISTTSSAPVTEPFHVDRPFLFVIHDVKHGTPLFLGTVDDPSE